MGSSPAEVRAARAYLRKRDITTKEVPPRKFANASKELDKSFGETLRYLMVLRSGGQNQSLERRENIRQEAEK